MINNRPSDVELPGATPVIPGASGQSPSALSIQVAGHVISNGGKALITKIQETTHIRVLQADYGLGFSTHLVDFSGGQAVLKCLDGSSTDEADAVLARELQALGTCHNNLPLLLAAIRTPEGDLIGVVREYSNSEPILSVWSQISEKVSLDDLESVLCDLLMEFQGHGLHLIDTDLNNLHIRISALPDIRDQATLKNALVLIDPEALSSSELLYRVGNGELRGAVSDALSGAISEGDLVTVADQVALLCRPIRSAS